MGLLTLAPAIMSGLEVKMFQYPHQFTDIETAAPAKPCLIFFGGEAMGRLTAGYFQPLIHRVVSNYQRFSFPFFFRSNATLLLDRKSLQSSKLDQLVAEGALEDLPGMTAHDLEILTQQQYKTRKIPLDLGKYKQHPYYDQLF